ncbi:hypothetical protein NW762_001624 [Fusarium torreyae]|uniref:Uncharacterized protein n=1 Tax=Fusarium torreyae TaxID=1237075 RepID=A0A9W8SE74_9HYPO|nr:hypothetical protein NW762_001624 [Fusarium torreyae]
MGFVDERNNTKHAKRGKGYFPPPPDGCWVTGLGESSYWYIPVYSGDDVYACMMGHKGATGQLWNCPGDEWWPDSYVDEIIAAGQEQTTKDGSGEQSEKGVFTAQWEGQTTAVSDREGMAATLDALFRYSLPSSGAIVKARHYYYNFKGEA